MPSFQVIRPERVGPIPDDSVTDVGNILAYAATLAAGKTLLLSKHYFTNQKLFLSSDTTVIFEGKGQITSSLPRVFYGSGLDNLKFYNPRLRGPGSNIAPLYDGALLDDTIDEDGLDLVTNGQPGGAFHLLGCTGVRIYDANIADFYNGIAVMNGSDCEVTGSVVDRFRLYASIYSGNDATTVRGGEVKNSEQTRTKNTYGLAATGATRLIVDGLRGDNIKAWDFMQMHECNQVTVCNCVASDVRMALDISGVGAQTVNGVSIHDNDFTGTDDDLWGTDEGTPGNPAIQVTGSSPSYPAHSVNINNNRIRNFHTFPPSASSTGAIILDNIADAKVSQNQLDDIGDVGIEAGAIAVYRLVEDVSIDNNKINVIATGGETGKNTVGVLLRNSDSPTCSLYIRDNTVNNADAANALTVKVVGTPEALPEPEHPTNLARLWVIANPGDPGMTHYTETGPVTITDPLVVDTY